MVIEPVLTELQREIIQLMGVPSTAYRFGRS